MTLTTLTLLLLFNTVVISGAIALIYISMVVSAERTQRQLQDILVIIGLIFILLLLVMYQVLLIIQICPLLPKL